MSCKNHGFCSLDLPANLIFELQFVGNLVVQPASGKSLMHFRSDMAYGWICSNSSVLCFLPFSDVARKMARIIYVSNNRVPLESIQRFIMIVPIKLAENSVSSDYQSASQTDFTIFSNKVSPFQWLVFESIIVVCPPTKHPAYPLVNFHIPMERSTMFNKTPYFNGHFQ